ncbi:acrylyl-CoA reductase family protein [Virgibacillus sediminis]|uniref:Acryloyl-CoA reductase n=1 Tax=Virgibacillus sediminis TaxID=202260 RepID=A0ABV7A342_9BACI
MDQFQALVLEKGSEGTQLGMKQCDKSDLPEGEVTIQVAYSSINYKDALVGIQHQLAETFPLVPGIDLAGTIIHTETPEFSEGDEVIVTSYGLGTSHWGGYSELARVPKEWVVPLPEGLSLKEAMILGTAGLTAGLSIQRLEDNGLHPEQGTVLVAGATGGVGSLAVDMLSKKGYRVAASTGKAAEEDYLKNLGAAEIIGRKEIIDTDGTPTRKKQWAGAVDPVGGNTLQYILSSLESGGSVATSGMVGGVKISTTVLPFIGRGVNWLGIDSVQCPMKLRRKVWNRLSDDLKPVSLDKDIVNEVSLEDVPYVLEDILESKVRGRTIVKL